MQESTGSTDCSSGLLLSTYEVNTVVKGRESNGEEGRKESRGCSWWLLPHLRRVSVLFLPWLAKGITDSFTI